ncbi:MAG: TIM-barrel domain-containing protein [Bacteroidales bacterium]
MKINALKRSGRKGALSALLWFICVFSAKTQVSVPTIVRTTNTETIVLGENQWKIKVFENDVVEIESCLNDPKADTSVSRLAGLREVPVAWGDDSTLVGGNWRFIIAKKTLALDFYYKEQKKARFLGLKEEESGAFSLKFDISGERFITGGGMRAIPLNILGRKLELRNQPRYGYGFGEENLNYSLPLFITESGYAIFFDNTSKGWADIGHYEKGVLELEGRGGRKAFYVIPGKNIMEITQRFTSLTGRQPLPPLWALGHLQSRMAYRTQSQVDSIANATLQAGFPLDAMIIDLFWFGHSLFHTMGNLDWYRPHWPDPIGMINGLQEKGVQTVLITEPYLVKGSANWKEADSLGILGKTADGSTFVLEQFYFGHGAVIDVTHPEARAWMWKKYDTLMKQGVAGWWIDLAEPEHHPDGIYYRGGKSEIIHNAFGHLWDKMLYDNYQKYYPGRRIFNLNRSGFAGSQRFGVLPWTGDVSRSWSGLKAQIPILLNMSICGVAYVHSDAGGFAQGTLDEELYTRWLQFACFSPILRPHGSGIPSEPIFFSRPTQDIVRKFMLLRYQLLPYNYSLTWENYKEGTPLARPLFAHRTAPSNELETWSYFWGPSLLVSPVLEKGEKWHRLWLPEGSWYYFFNDRIYEGNKKLRFRNRIDELPLFVRAGSFLPMVPPLQNTRQYSSDTLIIHYFPAYQAHEGTFSIYVDDGADAHAPENGKFELIHLKAEESQDRLAIHLESENRGFSAQPARRLIHLIIHGKEKFTCINDVSMMAKSSQPNHWIFTWDNSPLSLSFQR